MENTMKKNHALRAAGVVAVCAALSMSLVGGTLAKYTTADSGSDSARVAKWGVTAIITGDAFGADYADSTGGNKVSATYTGSADSAKAANGAKIVAPGTQSDQGITISVSGTPEVKNTVTFTNTAANNEDIYLKAGTYGTMVPVVGITTDNFAAGTYYKWDAAAEKYVEATSASEAAYELHDNVTIASDYYPVVWTVTSTVSGENPAYGTSAAGTYTNVADMMTAINGQFSATHESLDVIDSSCNISWAWSFNESDTNDGADTILGNIIAAQANAVPVKSVSGGYGKLTDETDYNTDVALNYALTIVQVD